MFKRLKQVAALLGVGVETKKTLSLHVDYDRTNEIYSMKVPKVVYPTFKLLLQDLAEMRHVEIEIIED